MKRNVAVGISALILFVVLIVLLWRPKKDASMLLINGAVYTVNAAAPSAEAIAIENGHILALGSSDDILSTYSSQQIIDLQGKGVYPGFIDAHAHLEGLGASLLILDLTAAPSVEEIQRRIRERVAVGDAISWIRGRGWDQNLWQNKAFPTKSMLDSVTNDIPAYLVRVDGHAVWINSKAMELAGVTNATADPEGGRIERDEAGNPTGVFVDRAVNLIASALPAPSDRERMRAVELAIQACLKIGLTEVHDMGVDLEGIEIYRALIREKKFPFRVYVAIDGVGETWDHFQKTGPELGEPESRLIIRALKLYADGALGSRGAALIEPYADDPGNRGLTLIRQDSLQEAAAKALAKGFQVCTHAIGDRGNHIVLNAYERAFQTGHVKGADVRFRVEHAQVVLPDDIPRFSLLGIIPSMQPTHCASDMYWAGDRIGPDREKGAYAWRSFIKAGSIIPGGSDFPVESPNPLLGFYAAITRQDVHGWPKGGWHPEERMTREEALESFTSWAAYASFQEKTKGTLEPGKVADLVVLSNDIMKVEPALIPTTAVDITMIEGEVVYSSGEVVPPTQ